MFREKKTTQGYRKSKRKQMEQNFKINQIDKIIENILDLTIQAITFT